MGLLALMGEAAGALMLIEKLTENPKARSVQKNPVKKYSASFLYPSGAIEAGHKLTAASDAEAARKAHAAAKERRSGLFGLHEVTGKASDGRPLIRPVDYTSVNPRSRLPALPKSAREFALKNKISLGRDPQGYYVVEGTQVVERSNADTAQSALVMMKRYLKARTAVGWRGNPRSRSKGSVKRASQATGRKPTKRLVKRRAKTKAAPKGFFANPVKHGYDVEANGARVATFKTRTHAREYGQAFANKYRVQVKLREV
jgi:hypothetical protein